MNLAEAQVPPPQLPSGRTRALLRWFGIDATGLDPAVPCGVCGLPALVGGDRCPSHVGAEVRAPEIPGVRMAGVLAVAATLAVIGAVLGAVAGDDRFTWIGALAAASQVAAGVARQVRFARIAAALGMIGFFAALTLLLAAVLVSSIAALPWLLEKLLGS